MKTIHWVSALILFAVAGPSPGQNVRYGTGAWNGDELGNHRAVVRVDVKADAAAVRIPWRRRDADPDKKGLILIDAKTGARVKNMVALAVNREYGDLVFQPVSGPGDYYVYFMPYRLTGSRNYPNAAYLAPEKAADQDWLARNGLDAASPAAVDPAKFARGAAVEIQSVDAFNSFSPMEVIATAEETKDLLAKYPEALFLLFPEDRLFSIRMTDDLPQRWIASGPAREFRGEAARGEFYAFQIGIYACRADIPGLAVEFGDLKSAGAGPPAVPASAFRSINTGGTDWNGRPLKKIVPVPRGKIQALWCGVQVPENAAPGEYESSVRVVAQGLPAGEIKLKLKITSALLEDGGDGDPPRMSRLRWLDSMLAFDDEVPKPFTPLKVEADAVSCLGRTVLVAASGLPRQIRSFFTPEVTGLAAQGRDILAGPFEIAVTDSAGAILRWSDAGLKFTGQKPGAVTWESVRSAGPVTAVVQARMEMDGFLEFKVRIAADRPTEVKDIALEIPLTESAAKYMMGLGAKGGLRPSDFQWTWDQKKNQDALWIGDVNAGLQVCLRAENYSRPLNTNFYLSKPLAMPPSWSNEGKGGVTVKPASGRVLVRAASGPRTLKPGQDLHFDFTLLLTPFKTIDTKAQWATRFLHAYKPLDEVAATGANTINIHHANEINPTINYPFLRVKEMKAYIDDAHRRGLKVKIYNTIRELSNRAPEIFALRSLGSEIFSHGPGRGYSWLQEHLGGDYIPAWFVPQLKDAAVVNSGMSRWHNYYIEGLNWLAKNVGIDGLYIDDLAFDRTTMKRVRKVLDRNRPGALIDLHSANQYNPRDGFASSANLYLDDLPYIDRLWFGEYFDYGGSAPDYWLVEVSGIPFGLMGEMLQDGGNPWRGMIYGMTNRLPWSGKNPADIWKVWDEFGMAEAKMIGYWAAANPVRTDNPDILATSYVKSGRTLISLASWSPGPAMVRLKIDWKALGIDPAKARLRAPAIPDVQLPAMFAPGDPIPFEPGKGWLLILE
jgi:hypothetical protein